MYNVFNRRACQANIFVSMVRPIKLMSCRNSWTVYCFTYLLVKIKLYKLNYLKYAKNEFKSLRNCDTIKINCTQLIIIVIIII